MTSFGSGTDRTSLQKFAFMFDDMSLQSWGLSNRTLTCLLSYNFKMTVGDVIRAGESLTSVRGLDAAGIEELAIKISQLLAETQNIETELSADQSTILSNPEASGDQPLKILPQSVQSLSLDQLHLDVKTHNALVKGGIATIGQLYNAENVHLHDIQGFHSDSLRNVNGSLTTVLHSMNHNNEVNWFQYWKAQQIQILPTTSTSTSTPEQVIKHLPQLIEEIFRREPDERYWLIIQRRFGLGKAEKLTLEDMGNVFSLTRERIRQLEEKALRILENVLVEQHYAGKNYHIHPLVHKLVGIIQVILAAKPNNLILETKLLQLIHQRFIIDAENISSSIFSLLSLLGAQRIAINYPNAVPIWGYIAITERRVLESRIKRLDDFLTREMILPQNEVDILVRLNKGGKKSEKLTLAELSGLIDLCSSIEKREDGSVWGRFEYLKGRSNQVERILLESGSRMRIADIVRTINHRLVSSGQHRITALNLKNQIVGDDRFVPIGRSGQWGLKSSPHLDAKSVLKLMEECLIAINKPATIDEIFTYVSERRRVSKHSIGWYLTTEKETFVKAGRTTWGLVNWSDAPATDAWNEEQIADFVANIFKRYKVKELDYKIIKEALMQEADVSAKQAQGLLNYNPVIKTRKGAKWDRLLAGFQSNYKVMLAQGNPHFSQRSAGLRQRVEQSVHDILEALPNKQMPMAELIRSLQKQFDCAEATLYSYIEKMNAIDRIDAPTSHTKICRLKNTQISARSGTLRQRISEKVRGILETAPNKQISLAELIVRLRKEYNCPKATLYRYIADLEYIERLDVPGSRVKILCMKGTQGTELFPQVQTITNTILREHVNKAVFFLTEENVDMGLFQLGRAFETTLKAFLVAAYAKGKLTSTPGNKSPDRLTLVDLISCLKSNGIVSDDAALSYLRQSRNDRAHSGAPSIEERRLLMKNAQHLASLYIDCIKWFDDLQRSL